MSKNYAKHLINNVVKSMDAGADAHSKIRRERECYASEDSLLEELDFENDARMYSIKTRLEFADVIEALIKGSGND